MSTRKDLKISFVSLGCDKNLVDSEKMLNHLRRDGFVFTDDEYQADIIVVNTCCFIGDAKEESINTLISMGQMKQEGNCKILIAAGCLAQRYRKEIEELIPEVDGLIGTTSYDQISDLVMECLENLEKKESKPSQIFCPINRLPSHDTGRINTSGGYYAYLKIAEGCDKWCTYCIIPRVRGSYRSVPMEEILEEARALVDQGARELILVAQETTLYGTDLYKKKSLHLLLEKLCEIEDLKWIRILYCYPEEIYPELIETMRKEEKICHYLDIPIQHSSDQVLKAMGRRTNRRELLEKIANLREAIPDIAIRTTLITGFPGERPCDHEDVMDFIKQVRFDRLGVFTYSAEEDTKAYSMPNQIEEEVKENYRNELMELQQTIAFEHANDMVGKELEVMVEGKLTDEDVYVTRTYMDAPGVDGNLFLKTTYDLMSGDFVKVRVIASHEYDLIGELVED